MKKMTIAQRRERKLEIFNEEYIHDMETARRIINSYYRFAALRERIAIDDNIEMRWATRAHEQDIEKAERWEKRLNSMLNSYGLKIGYSGYIPDIVKLDNNSGAISDVFSGIFYE